MLSINPNRPRLLSRGSRRLIFIPILMILILSAKCACAYSLPKLFNFNIKNALDEWQEKVFKNRVLYLAQPEQKGGHLLAKSKKACSGLIYKIKFDPQKYPMLSWKWKVIEFPNKNIGKNMKGGWLEQDDYAARVYIIFPSWLFMNIKCIEYVWDENLPKGKILTSPYFENIKLIVAESGKQNADQWVMEEHNIYEDYKQAFGKKPGYVGAIALMTDSDNTLSTAEALYTDIKVGYKK